MKERRSISRYMHTCTHIRKRFEERRTSRGLIKPPPPSSLAFLFSLVSRSLSFPYESLFYLSTLTRPSTLFFPVLRQIRRNAAHSRVYISSSSLIMRDRLSITSTRPRRLSNITSSFLSLHFSSCTIPLLKLYLWLIKMICINDYFATGLYMYRREQFTNFYS